MLTVSSLKSMVDYFHINLLLTNFSQILLELYNDPCLARKLQKLGSIPVVFAVIKLYILL